MFDVFARSFMTASLSQQARRAPRVPEEAALPRLSARPGSAEARRRR
jgi:hypothetical protein